MNPLSCPDRSLLELLASARHAAEKSGEDVWQFSIELHTLIQQGHSPIDIRRLASQGYIDHGVEHTRASDRHRCIVRAAHLGFSRSCFILTLEGLEVLRAAVEIAPADERALLRWFQAQHRFFWGKILVKSFMHEAPQQEAILDACEAAGWLVPAEIELRADAPVRSKWQLRSTIKNLNRNVAPYLQFHLAGSGSRVLCEPLQRYPGPVR